MTDVVSKEKRSEIMSKIKSGDTTLEDKFRKAIWKKGLRYRKNVKNFLGKPDIFFPRKRLVVFLDSCFWHGCEKHCRMPSSNIEYWKRKIERNKKRDIEVTRHYKNNEFKILRLWEHEIKENIEEAINKVEAEVKGY